MTLKSISPHDGNLFQTYEVFSEETILKKIQTAKKFQKTWKQKPFSKRAEHLYEVAQLLEKNTASLASVMTKEMGKPISQSQAEIKKCAWVCRYYAEHGASFLKEKLIPTAFSQSKICFEPLGVVLGIMPWNFPFWQVFRFAIPTLFSGNTVLLKHASNVTTCALEIEKLFQKAGFQEAFQVLLVNGNDMDPVLTHPDIAAVSLTGSSEAGKHIAQLSGKHLKKTVLELGGSDPYLILEDADLDLAVEACIQGRFQNTGQSCIAAKRWILVPSVYKTFLEKALLKIKALRLGNPFEKPTDLGPLARDDLRQSLDQQVQKSVEQGAKLLLGGTISKGSGFFYPATLLAHVNAQNIAFKEELFGPVAVLIPAQNLEHAIELANQTCFGLGAAIFSKDKKKALQVAASLQTGSCFINGFVRSDPRLPFGGTKQSGWGRELSREGILEFVNQKTMVVI